MKKTIPYIIVTLFSIIVTFLFFEAMSWYHFGDIPTPIVLFRLIGFCCVIIAILGLVVYVIAKNR